MIDCNCGHRDELAIEVLGRSYCLDCARERFGPVGRLRRNLLRARRRRAAMPAYACPYCGSRGEALRCEPCRAPRIRAEVADSVDAVLAPMRRAAGGER